MGKLKQEWLNDKHFRPRKEARAAIFYYIEVFYNRQRRHAGLDYTIPSMPYLEASVNRNQHELPTTYEIFNNKLTGDIARISTI